RPYDDRGRPSWMMVLLRFNYSGFDKV
nr:hypothetical protein [Tanacetum cinerariifolium]